MFPLFLGARGATKTGRKQNRMELKYKRVSLKLSGEALGGADTVDFDAAGHIAGEIQTLNAAGVQVGVTIGGGNIWRGRSAGEMDRNKADQMGMLALYNLISTSQKEDQPMNIGAVKDMIDNAIMKSKGGIRKLISKKKVNQDGYKVLYEKDFN